MPLEKLGPYRLLRVVGRGGMGAVYAGVNETTGAKAAVKVLAEGLAEDPGFRERFITEIETLKKLRHPNIVQLDAYGEEDGHLFYVMELVEGTSLQEELVRGRRFNWREVTRIGVYTAKALKHAHDRGIIHRDLKPANLLLDLHDQIKLADFGIAKLFGANNLTMAGGVIGTADYMSPEQAEGKPVTTRSDLYSLGSVLYALLAGRPPYAAKTVAEVLHGLRFDQPISVQRLAPDTPEPLDAIVMQLLAKDPAQRIPTAIALANRLQAMEHALSVETRIVAPGESALRFPELEPPRPNKSLTRDDASSQVTAELTPDDVDYRLAPPDGAPGVTAVSPPRLSPHSRTAAGAVTAVQVERRDDLIRGDSDVPPAPIAARTTHFTTVTEAERRRAESSISSVEDDARWTWLKAAPLAAGCLGLILLFYAMTRPPTADALFARITSAADSGDVDRLKEVEPDMVAFLERFPDDPRGEQLKAHQETLQLQRLEQQFDLRARRRKGVDELHPAERAYLDAVRLSASDPEAALRKFEAVAALFDVPFQPGEDVNEGITLRRCVELARKQAERLRETGEKSKAEQRMFLRRRLEVLGRSKTDDDPGRKRDALAALIELYEQRPWAEDLVARAREMLDQLPPVP